MLSAGLKDLEQKLATITDGAQKKSLLAKFTKKTETSVEQAACGARELNRSVDEGAGRFCPECSRAPNRPSRRSRRSKRTPSAHLT